MPRLTELAGRVELTGLTVLVWRVELTRLTELAGLAGLAVTSRRGKLLARHRAAGRDAGTELTGVAELTRRGELTRRSELTRLAELLRSGSSAVRHAGARGELAERDRSRGNRTGSRLLLPEVRGSGRADVSRRELPLSGHPGLERGARRHRCRLKRPRRHGPGPHRAARKLLSGKLLPRKLLSGKLLPRTERPRTPRSWERPGARGPITGPGRAGLPESDLAAAGITPAIRHCTARSSVVWPSVVWPSPVLRASRPVGIGGARVRLP